MPPENLHIYEFGPYRLDAGARVLTREGEPVPLTPKAIETLVVLVERPGRVVGREELIKEVWPDTFVEENNLSVNVSALRKVLGTIPDGRPYIETLPRRGYRFAAEVRQVAGDGTGLVVERGVRERVVVIEEDHGNESGLLSLPGNDVVEAGARRSPTWNRWALISAAILLVAAAGLFLYMRQSGGGERPAPAAPAIKSLAVLPLRPLSPAEEAENYLGVGLADALITRLGSLNRVAVRPTSSVLRYDRPAQDSLAAARALGVDAILEGSYQQSGERIRVTAQLVSARDGAQLWAGTFDDKFTNIFALQDSVSNEVVRALALSLSGEEKSLFTKRHTANPEAYQLYLKGYNEQRKSTPAGWKKSIEYFDQAADKDPRYALAYAGLSVSYNMLSGFGVVPPRDAMPRAKEYALKAVELDDRLADAHLALGLVEWGYEWNWGRAEREFRRAIELGPTAPQARNTYAHFLASAGRADEAVAESRHALELGPGDPYMNWDLAWIYFTVRRYDLAVEQSLRTLALEPRSYGAHLIIAWVHEQQDRYEEALAELQKAKEVAGPNRVVEVSLAYANAAAGREGEARKILLELERSAKQEYVSPYHLAMIHTGLGEKDEAFARLREAYDQRMSELVFLKMEPKFEGLRTDPRFAELLRLIGFEP